MRLPDDQDFGGWTHTHPCPAALLLVTCIYTHPAALLAKILHRFCRTNPLSYFYAKLLLHSGEFTKNTDNVLANSF